MSKALTYGVNRRYRSGAVVGDEESEGLAGKVTRRGSVRVERWVRPTTGHWFSGVDDKLSVEQIMQQLTMSRYKCFRKINKCEIITMMG